METNPAAHAVEDEVRVQKLSHAVAERLRQQIVSGQRKAGEKLPLESDLLVQFKVSRPTVREALRILEAESLIQLGRGARAGATVLGPTMERAAEYAAMVLANGGATVGELYEARLLLEPPLVMQLAKKRDRKLFDELQTYVDESKKAIAASDYAQARSWLERSHGAMMRGTANPALVLMVQMLMNMQEQTMGVQEALRDEVGGAALRAQILKGVQAQEQLIDLLRQGKGEDAQTFWRKHMERIRVFMERSGFGARPIRHR